MRNSLDWVNRVVRLLIGLPVAVSFIYVRHFSLDAAYTLLGAGLLLIAMSLPAPWPERRRPRRAHTPVIPGVTFITGS
jgi:hypothetical protein